MDAARWECTMSVAPRIHGRTRLTCASVIRSKFVFLENKLVVDILDIGQVEIWFCDNERGLWGVHLEGL